MKRRKDGRFVVVRIIDGEKIYFYSKAETAEKAKRDIEKQMLSYKKKLATGPRFHEVATQWQLLHEEEVSQSTSKRYRPCIERAVEHFGNKFIKEITAEDINRFVTDFSKKYTALKTVKMQRSVINLIFNFAALKGYISSNPCLYVPLPKNLTKSQRVLPEVDEVEKIKKSIKCTFGLYAYLLLCTGMRRGEALALTSDDIDFNNNVIHINKSVIHISNKPEVVLPKTAAGIRDVILPDCLKTVLPKTKGILFSNENGEYLHQSNFNRLWKKYKEESGVSITPHQLRHAYATMLYDAGIEDKDAQTLLGHTNITLTRDIYTHISTRRFQSTINKLNSFINQNSSVV